MGGGAELEGCFVLMLLSNTQGEINPFYVTPMMKTDSLHCFWFAFCLERVRARYKWSFFQQTKLITITLFDKIIRGIGQYCTLDHYIIKRDSFPDNRGANKNHGGVR